jgi:hypothetical protein
MNSVASPTGYLGELAFNSTGVTTLDGPIYAASIQTDSSGVGAGSMVVNTGTLSTTGAQTYREQTSLTADTTITASNLNVLQSLSALRNLDINGVANLGSMTVGGEYTQIGDVTAESITVTGVIKLNGEIRTINDQIWTANNQIILTGASKLNAGRNASNGSVQTSKIVLGSKVYSEGGNYNLTIDATGDVVIANDIGSSGGVRVIGAAVNYAGMINELRVIAGGDINLLADVTTKNLQEYTAISTNIGSVTGTSLHNRENWGLTGTNDFEAPGEGYMKENNPNLVRTLISVDPTIKFNGAVNDTIEGTHSLIALSIARVRNQPADIIFNSTVGKDRKLYSLSARTLEYIDNPVRGNGIIKLGGNVSTVANQTYSTTMFEVVGNSAIVLSSESGRIRILTPAYTMAAGISLDYSFSKPPEVSDGPGLIRLADIVRDVPIPSTDFTAGSISNSLMRMALASDIPSDGVDAEVSVGDLESSDEGVDCKPGDPRVSCAADSRI